MVNLGSGLPLPYPQSSGWFPETPISRTGATAAHLVTTAVSLRVGHFLRRRFAAHNLRLILLRSSLQDAWREKSSQLIGFSFDQRPNDALLAAYSSLISFFGGGQRGKTNGVGRSSSFGTSRKSSFDQRHWTNILLAINVLLYVAQIATQGKLMYLGAKINSLINRGELWRLLTSSFLHANIGHLMVNCYSLNSVGPTVENLSGPKRFLAVYFISAIASTSMSYWFSQAPAVGASGAIFGLVGSMAVFVMRHRALTGGGTEDLQNIAHVIVLNLRYVLWIACQIKAGGGREIGAQDMSGRGQQILPAELTLGCSGNILLISILLYKEVNSCFPQCQRHLASPNEKLKNTIYGLSCKSD